MGQNVNYLLGGQNQLLGADPEVYRQQLIQREQQRIGAMPPQQGLASALGGLLGRGITNVSNDRGFFEVTDPVLQKLTTIQGVYDTALKNADPNDPMSFYTSLQKQFAEAGLGQQAMMAQLEGKKYEDMNLKSEQLKTTVYKDNPQLLDAQIAKARTSGDDALANRLAEQRGQIQVKIDLDRAKEVAGIALTQAQTEAQRAQASKLSNDLESGKFDWKVINDITGAPTHMAKINKRTGETTYEPIALPGGAPAPGGVTPPKGEKPSAASFDKRNQQPLPANVSNVSEPSPATATKHTVSLFDQNRGTYKLTQDPEYLQIVDYARQNAEEIGRNPTLRDRIGQAMKDLQAKRQAELGSFVKFE